MLGRIARILCTGLLVLILGAAPSAAEVDFLTNLLMSEEQEKRVAEEEHPKILEEFGGEHKDAALQHYVTSLVEYLGRVSDRPDIRYRVTILNSPVVNAFALPAGYLYVTRGLLALADSEGELAGVLSHEIGHVTARHTAQRYSRAVLAQVGLSIFGKATQGTQYADLAKWIEAGAGIALMGYSREHEHEADNLGVKFMSRAGYDPNGMATFLARLEDETKLQTSIAGAKDQGGGMDLLSTHPRTAERVRRTLASARLARVDKPMVEREVYLGKIDGILFGDDPKQGFVRGQSFIHPELGIRFEAPPGFHVLNGQSQVLARGPQGAVVRFDRERVESSLTTERYLREKWANNQPLDDVRAIDVNGLSAHSGRARLESGGQSIDLRLVAIRAGADTIYRFMLATPPDLSSRLDPEFEKTLRSFRRPTPAEAKALQPYHLRIVSPGRADTVEGLANRMPFANLRLERFRVLNGLKAGEGLRDGRLVKIITEG